jgi:hypothetical protein
VQYLTGKKPVGRAPNVVAEFFEIVSEDNLNDLAEWHLCRSNVGHPILAAN